MKVIAAVATAYLGTIVVVVGVMTLWLWTSGHGTRPARLWRAAVLEVASAALLEILLPLGLVWWPGWWRRPRRPGEVPVVFVHGYAQNRADFYVLAARLARRGRGSLFALNYWPFGPVAASAATLARTVGAVRAVTGAPRVHLVGHSMGGLVSRHFIEQLGGESQVASLITLASPFAGTTRIRLGLGACAAELCPGSAYLDRLGPPAARRGVRYHSLWSRADALVVPPSSASLLGTGPEHVLDDAGHLTVLTSSASARVVAGWLADETGALDGDAQLVSP